MSISLSVIIPAFNESQRLPPFLRSVRSYLDSEFSDAYEVIVVDDGSTDGSCEYQQTCAADWPQLRVIRHAENRGKGAAVRTGMQAATGELHLFADADGATPIGEERGLRGAIAHGADIAIGSRLIQGPHVDRQRAWFRGIAGRTFATLARSSLGIRVRDTQCGFKMFRHAAAQVLFSQLVESGYLFDLELLYRANRLDLKVEEVAVSWSEQPGSHLTLRQQLRLALVDVWRLRSRLKKPTRK